VPAAYSASYELLRAGLDFVLAPTPGASGRLVHLVDGFPVLVFCYQEVSQLDDGPVTRDDIAAVHVMLSRVHQTEVAAELPRESFTLPFAGDIERALAAADEPLRDAGPYSGRVHSLLRQNEALIARWRAEFDGLRGICASAKGPIAFTHGEPLPSNVLRSRNRLLLADWGEAMWGPPERDWSHVLRTLGAAPPCRPEFLRLYQLRWALSEVAEYASIFLAAHGDTADAAAMWGRLLRYLPEALSNRHDLEHSRGV
jgi:spectinomycin phosphotransferase